MAEKVDFGFTEDGDLILSPPKLDENGDIIYNTHGTELKTVNDLTYVFGRSAYQQIIMNRLKTDAPDWFHHPKMGGNLTDLVGEPNTRETASMGVQYIVQALTYDGFLSEELISIRPMPLNYEEILFMLTVEVPDDRTYRLPLVFNLTSGLKEV